MSIAVGRPHKPAKERFWQKVDKNGPNGCWQWMGGHNYSGYGIILQHGEYGPAIRSHRLSYEMAYGPIPKGKLVCHRCDNRSCVNPSHLFLGTHKENSEDMVRKGRSPSGERQGRAKLTRDKVASILAMVTSGVSRRQAAIKHNVSTQTVCNIINGKSWKGVVSCL